MEPKACTIVSNYFFVFFLIVLKMQRINKMFPFFILYFLHFLSTNTFPLPSEGCHFLPVCLASMKFRFHFLSASFKSVQTVLVPCQFSRTQRLMHSLTTPRPPSSCHDVSSWPRPLLSFPSPSHFLNVSGDGGGRSSGGDYSQVLFAASAK